MFNQELCSFWISWSTYFVLIKIKFPLNILLWGLTPHENFLATPLQLGSRFTFERNHRNRISLSPKSEYSYPTIFLKLSRSFIFSSRGLYRIYRFLLRLSIQRSLGGPKGLLARGMISHTVLIGHTTAITKLKIKN